MFHRNEGGGYSVTFTDFDSTARVFGEKGFDGGGYAWEAVVDALLRERAPEMLKRFRFDPEAGMFCAYGPDPDALAAVAELVRELVDDPALLRHAIDNADPELIEG